MDSHDLHFSRLSAEVKLAECGLTADRVRLLTGQPPKKPEPVEAPPPRKAIEWADLPPVQMVAAPKPVPKNLAERHAAAVKAVELVKSGISTRQALWQVGLSQAYASGVTVCLRGKGPYHDAARSGASLHGNKACHVLSFVRWFLNVGHSHGLDSPDNEKLRKALMKTGKPMSEIARLADIHTTSLYQFRCGRFPRMREEFRARVWAALN